MSSTSPRKTHSQFVKESEKVHGQNHFKYLTEYKKWNIQISIKCLKCGNIFNQKPNDHLQGRGCPNCQKIKHIQRCLKEKQTLEKFIERSNQIHNHRYDYSQANYINCNTKVCIICPDHGEFWLEPYRHYNREAIGCPSCNKSKGELQIEKWLIENNIDFIPQKKFEKCRHKRALPFDFFLPKRSICIEYQGLQHFQSKEYWGGKEGLEKRKKHDKIKKNFCLDNRIELMYITYRDKDISSKLNHLILRKD